MNADEQGSVCVHACVRERSLFSPSHRSLVLKGRKTVTHTPRERRELDKKENGKILTRCVRMGKIKEKKIQKYINKPQEAPLNLMLDKMPL